MEYTIDGDILLDEANHKWDLSEIILRGDGSYVLKRVDLVLGSGLYHVPNDGEWTDMHNVLADYVKRHPEVVQDESAKTPTQEELAASIRAERDRRITATDYLVLPDYPISQENLEEIKAYRQALRDIPQQPGFPWGGPDDPACPWPEKFVTQIDWPELTVNANIKAKLSF